MQVIEGYAPADLRAAAGALYGVMTERQRKAFEETLELDFAYAVPGHARFRVNVFQQRESLGAVMRMIPWEILPLEQLGMPEAIGPLRRPQARPGAGHRPDRLRQVDDARGDHRQDQPQPGAVTS